MSTLDNIDMWREILVRLPAESVIRFRVVSKGWRAVIDDPFFVRAHTNKHHQQPLSSSNVIIQTGSKIRSFCSLDLEALINGHQAIAATPLHLDVMTNLSPSCNGLVLTKKYQGLTMWNPLTHERLDLPPGSFSGDIDSYEWAIRLGYDCTTDDYKAVVILKNRDTHVYSLKSDSWRRIINCPRDPDDYGPWVFACGALNWLSVSDRWSEHDDDMIVALDLGTEKYSLLQMPQTRWNNYKHKKLLNVLSGCLAVCVSGYYGSGYLDVWVMKVYGDGDSWTKLFSIENKQNNIFAWSGLLRPAAFIMNERFVLLHDENQKSFLFDVETKTLKWVKIDDSVNKKGLCMYAQQMFVGTIFRLHANCGGGRVREIVTTKWKKASANVELVFCIRDAKGEYNVSRSKTKRGCRLSGEKEEKLEGGNHEWLYH